MESIAYPLFPTPELPTGVQAKIDFKRKASVKGTYLAQECIIPATTAAAKDIYCPRTKIQEV
jgi:hypothetical protein